MKKTRKYFLALLVALSITSTYPIKQSTATFLSLASGIGVGALIYSQQDGNVPVGTVVGACTAGIVYLIAREFTPERKFERAIGWLYLAESELFVRDQYISDHAFFDAMQTAYARNDLPYAVAYYDLTDRLAWLNNARDLFDDACSESTTLACLAQEYQTQVANLKSIIIDAIKRIKQTKEFTKQLKIYEKRRIAQQRLAIEERKAAARESQARAEHNQAIAQQNSAWAQHRQANAQYAQLDRARGW